MTDRELQQLFPDYLAGRLDPDLCRDIKERCEQSPEMRVALDEVKKYTDALTSVEPIRAPDDFLDKVHRRISEPRGVFHRVLKPFPGRLPIELAGVVITVLLVVLIFNPFSGKLPSQLVEQRASEYEERHNQLPAAPSELPEPKKDELPGIITHPTPSPRPPVAPESPPVAAQRLRKMAPSKSSAVSTARITDEKKIIGSLDNESFAPEQHEQISEPVINMEKSKKNVVPRREVESAPAPTMPARTSTAASGLSVPSSPPSPKKQETAQRAPGSEFDRPVSDADAFADDAAPVMESAPKARTERALSRWKKSKEFAPEQPAATLAPLSEAELPQPEPPALFPQLEQAIHRYRGSVDSIIVNRNDQVKIKISIPPKKLVVLKKVLSDTYDHPVVSDFLAGSSDKKVIVLIEINR